MSEQLISREDDESTLLTVTPPRNIEKDIYVLSSFKNCKILELYTLNKKIIGAIEIKPNFITMPNKVIIISHNASVDICTFFSDLKNFANNCGAIVVCYDYPTYGITKGRLTEKQCMEILDVIVGEYKRKMYDIFLMGISFGTGIVVSYAHKKEWVNPIFLVATHRNIHINTFLGTKKILFSITNKIEDLFCPIRFIHGTNDKIIEIKHARYLYKKINNKLYAPIWIKDAGHYDVFNKINIDDIIEVLQSHDASKTIN